MTESDTYVPPQQVTTGEPYKLSWLRRMWWKIQLWWALRGPRRIIREAIEETKARKPRCCDGPPHEYWKTGPPPALPVLPASSPDQAFVDPAADPRHAYVKPDIGPPIDVDLSKPLKGTEEASHA